MDKRAFTYKEFKEMGYEKLHKELKKMLAQAKRLSFWFNASERLNLLPALAAMHDLVAQPGRREFDPNKPNWADECRMLDITPEQVRQWKCRTAAEHDIRHLLGEEKKVPTAHDAQNKEAVKHLNVLVKAVLNGDEERAERLANAFLEMYQF